MVSFQIFSFPSGRKCFLKHSKRNCNLGWCQEFNVSSRKHSVCFRGGVPLLSHMWYQLVYGNYHDVAHAYYTTFILGSLCVGPPNGEGCVSRTCSPAGCYMPMCTLLEWLTRAAACIRRVSSV